MTVPEQKCMYSIIRNSKSGFSILNWVFCSCYLLLGKEDAFCVLASDKREIAEVDKKIGLLGKQQFAVEKIALSQLSHIIQGAANVLRVVDAFMFMHIVDSDKKSLRLFW